MCFGWGDYTGGGPIYEKVIIVLKAVSIAKLDLLMHNKILKRPPSPLFVVFFFLLVFFLIGRLDPRRKFLDSLLEPVSRHLDFREIGNLQIPSSNMNEILLKS